MIRRLGFVCLDGERIEVDVPRGVNGYLVKRAIERVHKGEDADLVDFGLTRREVEFVAEMVAKLDEHRKAAAQ